VPALLGFLVGARGYSYALASSLLLFSSFGSSLLQPLLGFHADRLRHAAWMVPAGVALAAAGIAGAGVLPSYVGCAAALAVASVGVALFHPEAARSAGAVAAASGGRGAAMSVFAFGGTSGWAVAPLAVSGAVAAVGLRGTLLVAALPAAAAAVLLRRPPVPRARYAAQRETAAAALRPERWGRFAAAAGAASFRSGVQFGLQAFVPLYAWRQLHVGHTAANATVTVLLAAGAVGTLLGGRLADRFGFERTVRASFVLLPLLVAPLPFVPIWAVFVLMALVGLAMDVNFYPLVILAQDALPRRAGFASGIVLGLSIGLGALIASGLGVLADHSGLGTTMVVVAGIAAAALVAVLPLRAEL
jgi:FSR family fosmidomycin resistance protein-like MFS transporter